MSLTPTVRGDRPTYDALKQDWQSAKGGYHVEWPGGYRLEIISNGRRPVFPSYEECSSSDQTLRGKPVLVIGEEGAGIASFINFCELRQRMQHVDLKFAKNDDIAQLLYPDLHLFASAPTEGASSSNKPFRRLKKPQALVFSHLERFTNPSDLAAEIRGLTEGVSAAKSVLHAGLYFTARDERAFDSGAYSEISGVSAVCRPPRFNLVEITALLSWHFNKPKPELDPSLSPHARQLLDWTGGQPLLIQSALALIENREDLGQIKLFRRLRDQPPPVVLNWQRRLARLLEDRKDKPDFLTLRNGLRDVLKDQSYPIDADDTDISALMALRPLCLAGWLSPGLAKDGNTRVWRFSELHQFWAQPVLREPRAFLIRSDQIRSEK
ncbi:MAG: hypothetical protein MUE46_03120 [Xanthomonadales bacterium]|jgi:hypothetical protein|nr:hypothetical protein [Xanthomonadales bacterium]